MKRLIISFLLVSAVSGFAVPVLSEISFAQDEVTKLVTVSYRLADAPAVVTMSVEIGGETVEGAGAFAYGDVSRRVEPEEGALKKIYWQPLKDMPNRTAEIGGMNVKLKAWSVDAPPDYMVVDLDPMLTNAVRYYENAAAVPLGVTNDVYKLHKLVMRKIPAAEVEWCMGRNDSEVDFGDATLQDAEVGHLVTLSSDYYIGIYEFTQKQWAILSGGSWPSPFKGEGYPGYERYPVSAFVYGWDSSADPVTPVRNQLAKLEARTALDFDLPSEAQWEFACRAGCGAPFHNGGSTRQDLDEIAWHGGSGYSAYQNANSLVNGVPQPHVVGLKKPNDFGLYDMLGNVWEVCRDFWYRQYSDGTAVREPERTADDVRATENGINISVLYPHVKRGGDYHASWAQNCRSSARWSTMHTAGWWGTPDGLGFRPVCAPIAGRVE